MKQEISTDQTAVKPLQAAQRQQWVASLILQRRGRLLPRFALFYQRLLNLPRRARRGLVRKSAATLAGAALLLALGRAPVTHAATITVDGTTCTLIEAIQSANSDSSVGGCTAGNGADTLNLQADVLLTTSVGTYYDSPTGLPLVTTAITIEGNDHTISRDTADPEKFRLLAVSSSGDLTINETTLSGGWAYIVSSTDDHGGAIYNHGELTITNSTLSGNTADDHGGAVFNAEGVTLTITDSVFSDNSVVGSHGGALYNDDDATLTITGSTFSGNSADRGGALYNRGLLTITNSTFNGNSVGDEGDEGGALSLNDGTASITNSTFNNNTAVRKGGAIINFRPLTITNTTFSFNPAGEEGGAIFNVVDLLTITNSTFSGNTAGDNGGALFLTNGTTSITNSTISGNSAGIRGGGVDNRRILTITNSTLTDNTADVYGGGVFQNGYAATLTFNRSLISGNSSPNGREIYIDIYGGSVTTDNYNLFGHSGSSNAQAFTNFTPGVSDLTATSDGSDPTSLDDILETMLADNGGPTETHALVEDSPAIDAAPTADCENEPTNGEDQRGFFRSVDGDGSASIDECDIGAFEYGSFLPQAIYMTAAGPGTTEDGVAFGKEDILFWNGQNWSKFFDGTDEGLTTSHDINAIHVEAADDLYISFFQNKIMTADVGNVFGHDLLHFDGDEFSFYFDGSDVGLTTTSEKVDALHILDGSESPIGSGCDAYLLISTLGTGKVPAFGGGVLNFQGEDILGFCLTNSGMATAGVWHLALDGSAEGMPKNSTDSISASDDGETIYFTTKGTFNVDSAIGGHSMVYKYESGSFSGPFFSAPDNGLNEKVDGLHVEGDLP